MTFDEFERRCQPEAAACEDRMLRDISSPIVAVLPLDEDRGMGIITENDLARAVLWPWIHRAITGVFPRRPHAR